MERRLTTSLKAILPRVRRGATLMELAVSVAVSALMFTILGAIFVAQGRFVAIHDAIAETQVGAFNALDAVGLYASGAEAVVASRTISGTAYTTGDDLVILRLPSIDSNDDIIGATYDYVAFGLDPSASNTFIVDLDADATSARSDLKRTSTDLVDKVIFRYNTVDATAADVIEAYVRTVKDARGDEVTTSVGRIYYLGSS